jgi:hypothetical protein
VGTKLQHGGRGLWVFITALVLTTAIAVVDAAIGNSAIVISALVVGPLVAATAAGALRTASVYAYTLVAGVLLGVPDDIFLTRDHLARLLTVAVGGGLAVWIARLRETRERDSVGLAIQYAVARSLSEAEALEAGARDTLEAIARPLGWPFAALWQPTGSDTIRCTEIWEVRGLDAGAFEERSRELTLHRGEGLPGRVWASGELEWIPDVTQADNFPRGPVAAEAGLRGGVAFPVLAGRQLVGVMEFFAPEVRKPDRDHMLLINALGGWRTCRPATRCATARLARRPCSSHRWTP